MRGVFIFQFQFADDTFAIERRTPVDTVCPTTGTEPSASGSFTPTANISVQSTLAHARTRDAE